MNFPGRFDPKASDASPISLDGEHFAFAPNATAAGNHDTGSGVVVIPDAHLLFAGDYKRAGNDLILSSADQKYVVHDYFKTDKRPTLVSQDGATLSGHIVSALTGHAQYAQASAPASGQVIGQVMKLTGSASAVRNGVAVELNIGDSVQKGDVIQTGSDSSIGLTLADGTVFGMTSNARMVLNEMIYDPNGSSNSSLISLVQGTITFVAGQTAKNGNMRVETPVATMGIRGTAVLVEISANDGPTKFSVLLEPDGKTGSFNLYDKVTGQLLGTVSQAGQVTFVSPTGLGQPAIASEQPKTLADLQAEKQLIQQVFQLYFPNYNPDDSKPNSTKTGPRTDIGVPENVIGKYAINPDTGRATITYTVSVTNPDTHQTTNVNIVYTNTPPTFAIANAIDTQSTVLGPNSFRLGDRVTITDPDIGTAPFFDVPFHYVTNSGQLAQATGPASAPGAFLVDPQLVSLNVNTGVVSYAPSAFKFLGDGETAVYRFTFIAASGVGGSGSDAYGQTLFLTVTGQNDAPVFALSDTAPPSFIEIANVTHPPSEVNPDKLESTIVLDFTDEDFSDTVFDVEISGVTVTAVGADPAKVSQQQAMSFLTLTNVVKDQLGSYVGFTGATGKVTAAFSANDSVFDFLAEDEQIILTYTVRIEDGQGTFDTQTVTITVTGTNDTPQLTASGDTFGLNETTDAILVGNVSTLTVSGTIDFTDADLTDTHTTSKPALTTAVWLKPDGGGYISAGTVPPATLSALADAAAASYNSVSTGGLTGQVGWTFALADSLVDFLAENETLTLIYDVVIDDGHTDAGTSTQPITIVITGTNDAPIVAAPLTIATTEGDAPVVRDLLAGASDVDNGETATLTVGNIKYAVNGGTQTTTTPDGITFPDAHTINIDAAGLDHIAGGATETIVVSYDVTDVHGATVEQTETITITGVNDRPVLAVGADLTSITEDDTANGGQTVGSFATGISDVDDGALNGIAITGFTGTNGQWQFSIDDGTTWTNFGMYAAAAGLLLASDDKVRFVPDGNNGSVDTLTYVAWDQTTGTHGNTANTMAPQHWAAFSEDSQTATLTVADVNDAPVITSNGGGATTTISVAENTTAVTTVQANDVDGPNLTYQIVTGTGSPDAAKFTINATTGELSFIAAPDFEDVGNVNEDNAYIVQVRASDGSLSDIQTLTVNVTDVHEGPTYIVSSTADDTSPNTLRSAILFANANPGTMIVFAAGGSWNGAWVNMFSNLPTITGDGTIIDGTAGNAQVLLQASASRIFTIGNGVDPIDVTIRNIGMRYGSAETQDGSNAMGGAIYVADNVNLRIENNVFINQNHASSSNGGSAFGGAIYLGDNSTLELAGRVEITQNDVYVSGVPGIALGEGIYVAGPNGTITLMPAQGDTILFGDDIANGPANGGTQNLIVDGAGMVNINAVSSFSGTTTVVSGTLLVNYQGQLLNSAVTVEGQGVLIGGGSQPLYATGVGDLVILSGGVLAPGSTTQYGSNTVSTAVFRTGSLTLNSGATLALDANGSQPGAYSIPGSIVGHDQVMVYGTVTLNGATLLLGGQNGFDFYGNIGNSFKIIDNDGADAVTGTFANLGEGGLFFVGNQVYSITYSGGDGNDVVVTRVSPGNAPIAGDDFINVRSDYGAIKSTLISNDSDPDDGNGPVSFAISGAEFIVPDFSPIPATPITGGFKVQGTFGTLFLYSVATFDPIFGVTANAGDYVFNVGRDIDGNLISANDMAGLYDLAPGETLNDQFTYTITDTSNNISAPATITVTFETGPVSQYVQTINGYDTTQLWDDIHDGLLTSISPTQLIVENGGRTITIDAKNLDWTGTLLTQIVLTDGLIKGFHVSDGSGALFDATGYNIAATDFEAAVNNVNPTDLNNILKTYSYSIEGGNGADRLFGGDLDPNNMPRNDRIDTGGGADHIMTYAGDDLIIVRDNAAWNIDGGGDIDTIRLDAQFDLINGPAGQSALNVEIFDLNKTHANSISIVAEGVAQINGDQTVRILGNASDNVALVNEFTGHEGGRWTFIAAGVPYGGTDFLTAGVQFDVYKFLDSNVTLATAYVEQGVNVSVDLLNGDQITTYESGGGVTTVFHTLLDDSNPATFYSISAVADHGSVATVAGNISLAAPNNLSVQTINDHFTDGIVYSPNDNPPDTPDAFGQLNDKISLTVTDSSGVSDTLNFVFRQQGNGPATLVGTDQKDIIFSTENNDTLTGLSGKDNFVFSNSSGQDIVTDFQVGIDHLVFNDYPEQFEAGNPLAFASWLNTADVQQVGNDTLIDLDPTQLGQNTITLQNVQKTALSMNDFILHPSGGGGM